MDAFALTVHFISSREKPEEKPFNCLFKCKQKYTPPEVMAAAVAPQNNYDNNNSFFFDCLAKLKLI